MKTLLKLSRLNYNYSTYVLYRDLISSELTSPPPAAFALILDPPISVHGYEFGMASSSSTVASYKSSNYRGK